MRHLLLEAALVDRAELLEQHDGILLQLTFLRVELHVCRKLSLADLRGDRRYDHRGTVLVAHVVLNDQNRAETALFRPHDGTQVRVVNVQMCIRDRVPI